MQLEIVDWVSAKNKFFTHILRPHEPIATMSVLADRDIKEKNYTKSVAGSLNFRSIAIEQNNQFDLSAYFLLGT